MNLKLHVVETTKTEALDPVTGKVIAVNNVILGLDPVGDDDIKKNFVGTPTGRLHIGNLTDAGVAGLDLSTTHALAPAAADKPVVPAPAPAKAP